MSFGPIHFSLRGDDLEVEAKGHRDSYWFDVRDKGRLQATVFVEFSATRILESAVREMKCMMESNMEARWYAEQEAITAAEQRAMREE